MRVDVNLATQPYEDVRDFLLRWGIVLVLVAIIAAGLLVKAVEGWQRARDVNQQIAKERDLLSKTDTDIRQAQGVLNQPANKQIVAQSQFLNQLIAQKAFSWTQVFTELEHMMPAHLRVMSLHPELDDQNQLHLTLTVSGNSLSSALDLLRKMEGSRHFRSPQLRQQTANQNGAMDFQIGAVYVPQPVPGEQPTQSASVAPPAAAAQGAQ